MQPVIAYTIFISTCLKMCFEDTWLKQYFHLLLKICFLLFRCQMGGISLVSAKFIQYVYVNLLNFTATETLTEPM